MNKKQGILNSKGVVAVLGSVVAIIFGLLVGLLLMFVFNPANALPGFVDLLGGGFSDGARGVGNVLYYAAPYLMLGLSVAFSFQTGVFNIGVTGQYTLGATVAVILSGLYGLPWFVLVPIAGLCGMVWALVPGFLKAKYNVNEIITGIMMNYIAVFLCNQLAKDLYYDTSLVGTGYPKTSSLLPKLGLDKLFPGSSACSTIVLAVLAAIIIYVLLYKTIFGFELRVTGYNRNASQYAGINETKNIVLMMVIAGCIAGMGGGMHMLASSSKYYKQAETFIIETNYAIPIALLASNQPIGVIFAALFVAWLTVGGNIMQGVGFPVETVNMITGIILYVSAFAFLLRGKISHLFFRLARKAESTKEGGSQS